MAEPTKVPDVPATPEKIKEFDTAAEQKIAKLRAEYKFLEAGIKGVENAEDTASKSIMRTKQQQMQIVDEQIKQTEKFKETFDKNPVNGEKAKKELEKIAAGTTIAAVGFKNMTQAMRASVDNLTSEFAPFNKLIGSGSALAIAKMRTALVEAFNSHSKGLLDAQQKTLDFNKSVLQVGVSFGKSFKDSVDSVNAFRQDYVDTLLLVKATPDEIRSVRDAFRNLVPVEEQTARMTDLTRAYGSVKASLTPINEALFVSAATGMDAASVTSIMSSAYTELGSSMEETSLAFGDMFEMSKKSGLGFEIVSKSVAESAKTLKMWGGNLSTVAPLFKAFSDGLAGTGRQGLTPQLLQSFVSGINQMSFATRALFGMQLPTMKGIGALGAGLRMEAALEKKGPEGMKEISQSIIASMKQFGGGKVLTREEAIENPQLEKNFLVQRQLLMQQMGLDQATANRTLAMLQNIDKNGLQVGDDSEGQLSELLSSGEKVQESTQSVLQEASQAEIAAIQTSTSKITDALGQLAIKFGAGGPLKELSKLFASAASKGDVGLKQLGEGIINVMSAEERKQRRTQGPAEKTGTDKAGTEQKQEVMSKKEYSVLEKAVEKMRLESDKKKKEWMSSMGTSTGEQIQRNITQSKIVDLKEKGGGRIVTKEQASGDKQLEEIFKKQSQSLMQQMKISESVASKILSTLSVLDTNKVKTENLPQWNAMQRSMARTKINEEPKRIEPIQESISLATKATTVARQTRAAEETDKILKRKTPVEGKGAGEIVVDTSVKNIKFNDSTVTIKLGHVLTRDNITGGQH